jgi:GR25 family glycosyltransferase involved in LPS biosynthesis
MSDSSRRAYVPPHRRTKALEDRPAKKENDGRRERQEDNNRDETAAAATLIHAFSRVCCINLYHRPGRWKEFLTRLEHNLGEKCRGFIDKVERFDAIDGGAILTENGELGKDEAKMVLLEWDATKNAMFDKHIEPPMVKRLSPGEVGCAMSHLHLWKELATCDDTDATMLILEDDAVFYSGIRHDHHRNRPGHGEDKKVGFLEVFSSLWTRLPDDWEICYLGFSDRGERTPAGDSTDHSQVFPEVTIFRPTYGFHTHSYAIKRSAASALLRNLPVVGPLDVWLADNQWFGVRVYCGVVANEGWHQKGACLIAQDRKGGTNSDIVQSGRFHEEDSILDGTRES